MSLRLPSLRDVMLLCAGALSFLFAITVSAAADTVYAVPVTAVAAVVVLVLSLRRRIGAARYAVHERHHDTLWQRDENLALLYSIHDALGDVAVTRDLDGRILHANTVFRRMAGCGVPKGKSCADLGIRLVPVAGQGRFHVEMETPQGIRDFDWYDVVVRDLATGDLIVRSIARDVTEDRRSARAHEAALKHAESVSAAKSRLLATVSHEIRAPLGGILGMEHLLAKTGMTAEQRNYLEGIRQSGQALLQLVDDLLDFSTIEAGRFRLNPRPENIRKLIDDVVEMLANRAHEKGIEIGVVVSPDIPDVVHLDSQRLRQILFNLIGNAVKFTREGGVLVRVSRHAHGLVISVADSGPGMDAQEQARIFEEFEQAGSDEDRPAGTGLGLAISARIVRAFGGSLTVNSEKGTGSVFCVELPVSMPEGAHPRTDRLKASRVLLFAPPGPASVAIRDSITALGGFCEIAHDASGLGQPLEAAYTDVIVDHRKAGAYMQTLALLLPAQGVAPRRVLLVNPEARGRWPQGDFDSWLIRPLREQSLIDVLMGRLRGIEKRDALNDNEPSADAAPAASLEIGTARKILLAEDDPVSGMLVRAMLQKAGYDVEWVTSFAGLHEAVSGGQGKRPDMILSDLNMPDGVAIDMLEKLRSGEAEKNIDALPVIVLSADTRAQTCQQVLASGANGMMTKPLDPQSLLDVVNRLLLSKDL